MAKLIGRDLFTWREVEAESDLERLGLVLEYLPDERLMQELEEQRKATVERKSMREVLFEGLKWYVTPAEIPASPQKKKGKKKG